MARKASRLKVMRQEAPMPTECPFHVGQEVTVDGFRFHSTPNRIETVVRVSESPQFVELSDGHRWDWSGKYYPGEPRVGGPFIRPTLPGDRDAIEKHVLVERLSRMGEREWAALGVEALRVAVAAAEGRAR
jgi:hypothetical protein